MEKHLMNYETLIKITKAMTISRDPEEIILLTVKNIKKTLNIKGCALFLVNPDSNELCGECGEWDILYYPCQEKND